MSAVVTPQPDIPSAAPAPATPRATTSARKWLAIGTGVGIEIRRGDLHVCVVRVRPGGVRILGTLVIHKFREQAAAEWGAAYLNFLKKLGAGHLTATVLLPREEVTVRQLALPGVANKDVAAALRFQIDSLHPYGDEEPVYDWARIGKTSTLLVAIARRAAVEHTATLFDEAGIKVSRFACAASVLYSAAHLYGPQPEKEFAAIAEFDSGIEIYGESAAKPLFSVKVDMPPARARALAVAELRLPAGASPVELTDVLPRPNAAPADHDFTSEALPFATALAAACPHLALSLNLLPEKQRAASSRMLYVPTAVLALLFIACVAGVAVHTTYEQRRYVEVLSSQIRNVEPLALRSKALDHEIQTARGRAEMLDNFRLHTKDDMDALNDVTRVLAPPAWATSLQLSRTSLLVSGETDQAAGLLKLLDATRQFKSSEFTMPLSKNAANAEQFSIRSAREGITP